MKFIKRISFDKKIEKRKELFILILRTNYDMVSINRKKMCERQKLEKEIICKNTNSIDLSIKENIFYFLFFKLFKIEIIVFTIIDRFFYSLFIKYL
jgi:hypothetical protein